MKETTKTAKIKIIVQERETKDGRKFKVFKAVTKDGRLMDAKFRKDVKNVPEHSCYIYALHTDLNVDKNREYPVLWIRAVEKIEEIGTAGSNTTETEELFN